MKSLALRIASIALGGAGVISGITSIYALLKAQENLANAGPTQATQLWLVFTLACFAGLYGFARAQIAVARRRYAQSAT